LSYSPMFTSTI